MIISRLGEIVEVPVNVPRYTTCHTSVVTTGKEGRGELYYPYGVAIHKETHQIFVVNCLNKRIEIFSETGEFISQLGVGELSYPSGIAIQVDSLYVSCSGDKNVSQFSLIEMCHVRRIGGEIIFPRGCLLSELRCGVETVFLPPNELKMMQKPENMLLKLYIFACLIE